MRSLPLQKLVGGHEVCGVFEENSCMFGRWGGVLGSEITTFQTTLTCKATYGRMLVILVLNTILLFVPVRNEPSSIIINPNACTASMPKAKPQSRLPIEGDFDWSRPRPVHDPLIGRGIRAYLFLCFPGRLDTALRNKPFLSELTSSGCFLYMVVAPHSRYLFVALLDEFANPDHNCCTLRQPGLREESVGKAQLMLIR
jgi:hypothetical protein